MTSSEGGTLPVASGEGRTPIKASEVSQGQQPVAKQQTGERATGLEAGGLLQLRDQR